MIDEQGYRANVGIILTNAQGKVFWGKRIGQHAWQFPQGGISPGETPEQAMYRELYEEIGLRTEDVTILAVTPQWLRYRLPENLVRHHSLPLCIGQKQKWFLLRLQSSEDHIRFDCGHKAEFDGWRWVSYWYPMHKIVNFKRHVYRKALQYCASANFAHRTIDIQ